VTDFLPRLLRLYRDHEGIEICSGLNPYHFNNAKDASFTFYLRNGESLTPHLGISLWETLVLERFCQALQPSSIYVVGNGLGWSALALALINPQASVVAIDPESGIEMTNRIAFREGLRCMVAPGFSPADNERVIRQYCARTPDLLLIDGVHDNAAVVADFTSLCGLCGNRATYFFHDVVNFDLHDGLAAISRMVRPHGMSAALLGVTPSGMATVYPSQAPAAFTDLLGVFGGSVPGIAYVARAVGVAPFRRFDEE